MTEEQVAVDWARTMGAPEEILQEIETSTRGPVVTARRALACTVVYATADVADGGAGAEVAHAIRVGALAALMVRPAVGGGVAW